MENSSPSPDCSTISSQFTTTKIAFFIMDSQDLNGAFKIANLAVAGLSVRRDRYLILLKEQDTNNIGFIGIIAII